MNKVKQRGGQNQNGSYPLFSKTPVLFRNGGLCGCCRDDRTKEGIKRRDGQQRAVAVATWSGIWETARIKSSTASAAASDDERDDLCHDYPLYPTTFKEVPFCLISHRETLAVWVFYLSFSFSLIFTLGYWDVVCCIRLSAT